MIKQIITTLLLTTSLTVYAGGDTPPTKATEKPKVLKPCKEGQKAEKDNCHEVNKVNEKKK